ncbi:MAG TPA: DUF192 domain-containing protein [Bacteroidota bacterium]
MKRKGDQEEEQRASGFSMKWIALGILVLIGGGALMVLLRSDNQKGSSASTDTQRETYGFRKDGELRFESSSGKHLATIAIEIAEDEAAITIGLMNRRVVPELHGMLFIFPDEELRSFWMRNTYASLDIIFVNSNLEIVALHPYTQPLSDTSYPSTRPAQYVVEVAAGFAEKHGVQAGDGIVWTRNQVNRNRRL